jgi:O-antigen/teichoic acid export membrane protein
VSLSSSILRNIASNWAGYAVNAAVTLVLTPFVLHQLGDARYGVWVLTSSIVGYYGLHGVLAGASAAAIVLAVEVSAEERQRFLLQPVRRLLGRSAATTVN